MDMDATIKNYPINIESLTKAIKSICNLEIEDDVRFSFVGIKPIRDGAVYGGYRVSIRDNYDTIITPMQIDITGGDAITPREEYYLFKMIFEEDTIRLLAYNIETVLAEKVETILRRGEFNTRPRDFYDIYILTKTQNFNYSLFMEAIRNTSEHRETTHIFNNIEKRVESLATSDTLRSRWVKYTKDYRYSADITYNLLSKPCFKIILFWSFKIRFSFQ